MITSLARRFVAIAAIVVTGSSAWGQEAGRHYRLGVLTQTVQSLAVVRSLVIPELARLGFIEDRNLSITYDTGSPDELTAVAAKVVAQVPDAILAIATPSAQAARAATDRIPVVRFGGQDAVTEGFAETLARPIGNLTGVVILGPELDAKRLEVLHEAVPGAKRMAALVFRPYALRQEVERQLRDRASYSTRRGRKTIPGSSRRLRRREPKPSS
jgi:putative tryptophan/tyrosine transport system substrate-binding protein